MKKMLLLAALFAATAVSAQNAETKKTERHQLTPAQQQRAKNALKKAQKTLFLPQTVEIYEWLTSEETWYLDVILDLTYDEKGRIVKNTTPLTDEEGAPTSGSQTTTEYDENGNIISITGAYTEDGGETWTNYQREEYTYDNIVKDFCTSYAKKYWDGSEWVENIPVSAMPKAPRKKMVGSEQPFKYTIERDEQDRVVKVDKYVLKNSWDEETETYTSEYAYSGGYKVNYDEATGMPASFDYAPFYYGGLLKAPAKKGKAAIKAKLPIAIDEYPYHLDVEEWESCDPTQLLTDDPVQLTEGANRIKKGTANDEIFTYTVEATYDDNGGHSLVLDWNDGYKEVYSLTYTDDNGSYIEENNYIDENDVSSGLYYFDKDRYEAVFDTHGIMTEYTASYTDGYYNGGSPKLHKSWTDFKTPTYNENDALAELITGYTSFNLVDIDTQEYTEEVYYDSKEVYSDFFEMTVDNIVRTNIEKKAQAGAKYNIAGQRISDTYKGVVIQNGKKFIQK